MKSIKLVLALAAALSFCRISTASEVIGFEAMKAYAISCYQTGGISYISENSGMSWQPLDAEEVTRAANHGIGLALINAKMNGERITETELREYISSKVPEMVKAMEHAKILHCEGGRVSIKLPNSEGDRSNNIQEGLSSVPFVGSKYFNHAGGRGTEYVIDISKNGQVKIFHPNSQNDLAYSGPLTDPINANGWLLSIRGNKIYEVDQLGQVQNYCFDGESECVSDLY